MNLMPEILEKLGVKVDERFDVESDGVKVLENVYFDSDYSLVDIYKDYSEWLSDILSGNAKIVKPWKPQNRERGYYVNPAGDIIQNAFFKNNGRDVALVVMGNCFETEEEAEAAKPEMIAKMKEAWE